MTKSKQILTQVKDLLSDPKRWTKGASARTAYGFKANPLDSHAVCWCLSGAMDKVGWGPQFDSRDRAMAGRALDFAVYSERYDNSIPRFNDTTTHHELMRTLDYALAQLE